jgi:hypothetical protein
VDDTTFDGIRFTRNRREVEGIASRRELLAFVSSPDFDLVVAEWAEERDVFAQVANLDGTFHFEETLDGELMATVLDSPEAVVAAFADWAVDRPGWRDQHSWA